MKILSKKVKTIAILFIALFGIYFAYRMIFYNRYESVLVDSNEIKKLFNDYSDWSIIISKAKKYSIIETQDYNKSPRYSLTNTKKRIDFIDPFEYHFFDDKFIIVSTGPLTIASGIRDIILPGYCDVIVIDLVKFEIIKEIRLPENITGAIVYSDYVYFRFEDRSYGRVKL